MHPDDASRVVVAAIGYGYAGQGCQDNDGTRDDHVGLLTKGTAYAGYESDLDEPETIKHMDSCDADGNLVEYYCKSECTVGTEELTDDPWNCMLFGGVDSIRVRCDGMCLDGACVALP